MKRAVRRAWQRLVGTVRPRGAADDDLADEFQCHLDLLAEDYRKRGYSEEEARRLANLKFGGVEAAKESYRDQRRLPLLETVVTDVRYAVRGIRNSPGFAFAAILSLAIGIGANAALFSAVHTVLLQPMAFQNPERIFAGREIHPALSGPTAVNPVHAFAWARECPSIEHVAVMRSSRADLADGGEPISVPAVAVTHNTLALLGVAPVLGRSFLAGEEQIGRDGVVILSDSLWRSRFGADPAIVGKSILVNRQSHQVVGIMPSGFRLPFGVTNATRIAFDLFRPLALSQQELARLSGNHNYASLVRLKPGATAERALSEMNVVQSRFPRPVGRDVSLKASLVGVHEFVTGRARAGLWMLAASVGAVLLIVCVNLANLLLSRMASRTRDAAIRTALGASRGRQVRMILTETLLLALSGGALGIAVASWLIRLLAATTTVDIPRLDELRLDWMVAAIALFLATATGILFGAIPAWRFALTDPQQAFRAGAHNLTEGRGSLRLRECLIGIEVGLSAALLILAGLLIGSLTRLLNVEKGFDAARVVTADFSLTGAAYEDDNHREQFFHRVLTKLGGMPQVNAFGIVTELPTRGRTWNDPIYLEGSERRHTVDNRYASPGYFRAMSIAVIQGRVFDESDRGRGVAVLSEKAASLLWPGDSNPVGRSFMGEDDKVKTLVGVVADVRAVLQSDPPPMAYYPWWQRVPGGVALVVRTTGDPRSSTAELRAILRAEDPQLPIRAMSTMDEVVDSSIAARRFQLMLMAAFAGAALLVASLGIYGVVSYSVARRRNEIGVRMALGAPRSALLGGVVRQGMKPVAAGLAAGLLAALFLGRLIRGLLFGVEPADPATIAGVAAVLLAVGALACWIPARCAAGIDPVRALRFE